MLSQHGNENDDRSREASGGRKGAHRMAHDHEHGGSDGHTHGVSGDADRRWLGIALALIVALMAVEVLVGLLAHSLALLSDAAHMLTDAASIILALVAMRLAARPPKGGYTLRAQTRRDPVRAGQ